METMHLQCLVNKLMADITPATSRHRSFMVNEIPSGMKIAAHTNEIAEVLGQMFTTMARHASDSCIRITAKTYSDVVLVHLRDPNSTTSYTIAQGLYQAQHMAEKIGGYLGVTSQRKHETTIVFSFPNIRLAS